MGILFSTIFDLFCVFSEQVQISSSVFANSYTFFDIELVVHNHKPEQDDQLKECIFLTLLIEILLCFYIHYIPNTTWPLWDNNSFWPK